ncbi:MAG: hypothetical protein ABIJ39_00140 [Chloroflexota bacterium]
MRLQRCTNLAPDVVTDSEKIVHVVGFGRVGKTVVDVLPLPQPDRALLCGRITDGHHQVKVDTAELVGQL